MKYQNVTQLAWLTLATLVSVSAPISWNLHYFWLKWRTRPKGNITVVRDESEWAFKEVRHDDQASPRTRPPAYGDVTYGFCSSTLVPSPLTPGKKWLLMCRYTGGWSHPLALASASIYPSFGSLTFMIHVECSDFGSLNVHEYLSD